MSEKLAIYRSLVSADDSALVVIDYQSGSEINSSYGSAVMPSKYLDILITAARELEVPILMTVHNNLSTSRRFAGGKIVGLGQLVCREETNPWENLNFSRAVSSTGRSRLVVAGGCIETSVTFAVLSALEEGYEVFLVQDASSGLEEPATCIAIARMVQAGAVPVGAQQVVAEWRRGNLESAGKLQPPPL